MQVVDRVREHALLTLPSRNLSNLLGELNPVSLNDVIFPSLCTPPDASRAFAFCDRTIVGGVFKEATFTTGMPFNQTYWWVPTIATPVATLEADRISRAWMAHAEPGAGNAFYDLVPVDVGAAAEAVVDLVAEESMRPLSAALLGGHARDVDEEEEGEEGDGSAGGARGDGDVGLAGSEMNDTFSGSADATDVSARRL